MFLGGVETFEEILKRECFMFVLSFLYQMRLYSELPDKFRKYDALNYVGACY